MQLRRPCSQGSRKLQCLKHAHFSHVPGLRTYIMFLVMTIMVRGHHQGTDRKISWLLRDTHCAYA